MTNAADWQGAVGNNWAIEWQRTDRSFSELNAVLVDRVVAKTSGNAKILDIGCGAGATSFAVARRLPDASITGIDLSPSLIAAAKARNHDGHILFENHDATHWVGGPWKPDLLVSRHGVMFFDDPVAAFAHFRDIAAPDAQLLFSCFRDRVENQWVGDIAALLPVNLPLGDPYSPGPFAFADPGHVGNILSNAGWRGAKPEAVDFSYIAGDGDDPIADAIDFFSRIGPAAPIIRTLDTDQKALFFHELSDLLCNRLANGKVLFKAAAWIWSAHLSGEK
jgi:SAM-dependent methyltransferase